MNKLRTLIPILFLCFVMPTTAQDKDTVSLKTIAYGFLGKPYAASMLENYTGDEKLIINTDSVDCTTFVEYVLATRLSGYDPPFTDSSFIRNVERIRYRSGKLNGYTSRLHYFSDWIIDNTQKGILHEITPEFETAPAGGPIDFMSKHPDAYRQLRENRSLIDSIKIIEQRLSETPMVYIPKEKLAAQTDAIREGDIIAIVTTVAGLDISHVGFAVRNENKIYLLHASQKYKKVVVDPMPLTEYLFSHKSQKGIRILRLN